MCSTRVYPESMLWNNPFVRYHDQSEGKIVMELGIKIMGDTVPMPLPNRDSQYVQLIRCVHMSKSGERLKVFRIAFHTAFVVAGAARLGRDDLDDIKSVSVPVSYQKKKKDMCTRQAVPPCCDALSIGEAATGDDELPMEEAAGRSGSVCSRGVF